MTQTSINYATALYELAIPDNAIADTKAILGETDCLLESFLVSPIVSFKTKENVIDKIFPKEMHNFLKVLCRNQDIGYIYEIFDAYKQYSDEKRSILSATLYYVEEPDEAQKTKMKNYLSKKFSKTTVELTCIEKQELLGGFVIEADGIEIDRSLLGKVKQLQSKLVKR